eukprot:TRINITY_DN9212_c0_g1_i1.p1 TRINITY_DN9212_c0_g1~~TRINITY_DN9212_c0_g1_i1.p1  ORF type:complete len:311 (+),score=63.09 TRINITY_DN9212_c0_g1_i1:223-1155(+)
MEKVMANLPVITGNGMVCQICFCEYEEKEIEVLECSHFFCKECIANWIKVQVTDGKVAQKHIICPNVDCKKPMSSAVIEARADAEVWEKYKRFTFAMEVDRDKNAAWCPNDNCGGVIYRTAPLRKAICEKCNFQICWDCKKQYHGPLTSCTKDVDEAFDSWAKQQFMKRCPACSKFIIKLDGCNHMTCSCGYEFCWICGGIYYPGHFARFNPLGCPGLQYAESNGICTNFFLVRWFFKLLQIAIMIPLVVLACGIQVAFSPFACVCWFAGRLANNWNLESFGSGLLCCLFRYERNDFEVCLQEIQTCCKE